MFNDSLEVIHWEGSWTALSRVCHSIYSNATSLCQFDADCHFCLSFVEDQKVAAPDVALYGLHVIIPLMSPEVLKVSPPAPQFSFRHLQFIACESGITSYSEFRNQ